MSDILVSINCITYNHQDYIRDAIEGFLMQKTNFKFEVLIHDDASTDNTAKIIKEYQLKYPEIIKPIYQLENQYSKGRKPSLINLERATGKYIAYCEGDDYWTDPYKLQKQVDFMEVNPEYSMCGHTVKVIDIRFNEEIDDPYYRRFEQSMELSFDLIGQSLFFQTSSMVVRSEYFKKGYPKFYIISPTGDQALQFWMAHVGKIYYFNDVMSVYRRFIPSSWTINSYRTEIQQINFAEKMIRMLMEFNDFSNKKHSDVIHERIESYTRQIQFLKNTVFYRFSDKITDLNVPNHINNLKENENYIFGAGTDGNKLQVQFEKLGIDFKGFIDNNSLLHNQIVNGKPVFTLETISKNANILISAPHWAEEIINQLTQEGFNNYFLVKFVIRHNM